MGNLAASLKKKNLFSQAVLYTQTKAILEQYFLENGIEIESKKEPFALKLSDKNLILIFSSSNSALRSVLKMKQEEIQSYVLEALYGFQGKIIDTIELKIKLS